MDRSIIHAARNGDSRARDAVARWLYAEFSAVHQHRPPEQFDDLMQESVTEIFEKLAKAPNDDPVAFRDWALKFAGMRARALKRDRDRELARVPCRSPSQTPAESASVSVLGPLLDNEERQLVIDHAQQLQPIYRNAILHVFGGGDYKSLAASEAVAEGTAARRITVAATKVWRSIAANRRNR